VGKEIKVPHQPTDAVSPIRAIIASENPGGEEFVLPVDDIDEVHPLLAVSHDCEVDRNAPALAAAMTLMLRFGGNILFFASA